MKRLRIAAGALLLLAMAAAGRGADPGAHSGVGSLQARLDAAAPGATLLLPAGVYEGPVEIRKPLTLRGEPGAEIRGTGKGSVVTIAAEHVTLEGFRLRRSGIDLGHDDAAVSVRGNFAVVKNNRIEECLHGVYVRKSNDCRIEGNVIRGAEEILENPEGLRFGPDRGETCETPLDQNRRGNGIHLWNSERAVLLRNTISGSRDGIYFSFTNRSRAIGNSVSKVRFGLHYMYSDHNFFEGNRFRENAAGAVLMHSRGLLIRHNLFASNIGHRGYGLVLLAVDESRVEQNRFANNSVGLFVELSNGNTLLANAVVNGVVGIRLSGSSDANRFSRNAVAGNLHPVEIDDSLGENLWAIDGVGNYWADAGVDLDGNGIGDLPHRETDLLGALRRPFPLAALLTGSPALKAVRFAAQSVAIRGVPAVVDPAPLVRPPREAMTGVGSKAGF